MSFKTSSLFSVALASLMLSGCGDSSSSPSDSNDTVSSTFLLPDTNQENCYDSSGEQITCSGTGQDGDYIINAPTYTDNGDSTVTDDITGVMWQQSADTSGDGVVDVDDKYSQSGAEAYCQSLELAGYSDWELPDIKTMYSLIDFTGEDVSGWEGSDTSELDPFINDDIFGYGYGDTDAEERVIDAQWATTSLYVADESMMFGVNLADGRIKGYGVNLMGSDKLFYVQCKRNSGSYGLNDYRDNGDNTVTDNATGFMWQQDDNGEGVNWDSALGYCEDLSLGDYTDWRLPNAKELQSIVDYTESPDTTGFAALDSDYFNATQILNEAGEEDYGYYWTSTTHKNMMNGASGVYISFGRALGYMTDVTTRVSSWLDVHGAGAQRSDPKDLDIDRLDASYTIVTDANGDQAVTHGPQGDIIRGDNYVRCVRDVD